MKKRFLVPVIASALLLGNVCMPIYEPMHASCVEVRNVGSPREEVSGTTVDGFSYSGFKQYVIIEVEGHCTKIFTYGRVSITGYTGSKTDLVIPSKIDGCLVVGIDRNAFGKFGRYFFDGTVTSVTLPDTLEYIDDYAFYGAEITSINFPSSLKSIGELAFSQTKLKSVVIPESVQYVGEQAFAECTSMTSMRLVGAKKVDDYAFNYCTALKSVWIPKGSEAGEAVFDGCFALTYINGSKIYTMQKDENGIEKPVLTRNSIVRQVIRDFLSSSNDVKSIDDYCSAMCKYIVDTETRSWMSDNIKARQLYDWLIRNVRYEDEKDGETKWDKNNHVPSSVFLSCGLSDDGVGETVCEGYAMAYTMLLSQANIESYVLSASSTQQGGEGHAWNLVKIKDNFYQCDVTWDEDVWVKNAGKYAGRQEGTSYIYFLKTAAEMDALHNGSLKTGKASPVLGSHPLLEKYNWTNGQKALANSTKVSFPDTNGDGILDYDINLDGVKNISDGNYVNKTKKFFNNGFVLSTDTLDIWLSYLKLVDLSPSEVFQLAKQGKTIN